MKAAELVCSAIYRICRAELSKNGTDKAKDPKFLKEMGAAIKEALNVLSGFEKKKECLSEEIKIVFGTQGGEV